MNCDCIEREEKRLAEGVFHGILEKPKKAGVLRYVSCQGAGISFKSGIRVLTIEFHAHFDGVKKPMEIRMKADFCPFCGKSTEKKEGK
jgi:hypothetical protein